MAKIGAGTEQLYDTHIQNPNNANDFCNGLKTLSEKPPPPALAMFPNTLSPGEIAVVSINNFYIKHIVWIKVNPNYEILFRLMDGLHPDASDAIGSKNKAQKGILLT